MKKRTSSVRRGDVYLVNFDPTIGSEIQKTRPALIIQNDVGNRYSPVTIVAAITSDEGGRLYPTEVRLKSTLGRDSVVLLNQIRTVDKIRLVKKLGTLDGSTMRRINESLVVSLGLRT